MSSPVTTHTFSAEVSPVGPATANVQAKALRACWYVDEVDPQLNPKGEVIGVLVARHYLDEEGKRLAWLFRAPSQPSGWLLQTFVPALPWAHFPNERVAL